jgi:hypothetical protein
LHEEGKAGVGIGSYRIPLMVEDMQSAVEGVFDDLNRSQNSEYLPAGTEEHAANPKTGPLPPRFNHSDPAISSKATGALGSPPPSTVSSSPSLGSEEKPEPPQEQQCQRQLEFPTLALTPHQFAMIQTLDKVGFRKYSVYIHKPRHTHAAIIVRKPRKSFDEGKVVIRHWLDNEFKV